MAWADVGAARLTTTGAPGKTVKARTEAWLALVRHLGELCDEPTRGILEADLVRVKS